MQNLAIHVDNQLCAKYSGPSQTYAVQDLPCTAPLDGTLLRLQLMAQNYLQIAEAIAFADEMTCKLRLILLLTTISTYIKLYLDESIPKGTIVTASSSLHDLQLVIDKMVAGSADQSFLSEAEIHPWIQLEFPRVVNVIRVVITQRLEGDIAHFANVGIFVGNAPAVPGELYSTAHTCNTYEGPSEFGKIDVIQCVNDVDEPMIGKYLVVQRLDLSTQSLSFGEIAVHVSGNECNLMNLSMKETA